MRTDAQQINISSSEKKNLFTTQHKMINNIIDMASVSTST